MQRNLYLRSAPSVLQYAPILRIDHERREIIGTATAEVKDLYGTVIGYEASKDALMRWGGNIREMHQNSAVGRALEIIPDDKHRRIVVRATISKGAENTWQKVLDGTLKGFSIGGKNGKWTKRVINGEKLPYLERYDLAELSLVDNPACPACAIEIVRNARITSDILARNDDIPIMRQGTLASPGDPLDQVRFASALITLQRLPVNSLNRKLPHDHTR